VARVSDTPTYDMHVVHQTVHKVHDSFGRLKQVCRVRSLPVAAHVLPLSVSVDG